MNKQEIELLIKNKEAKKLRKILEKMESKLMSIDFGSSKEFVADINDTDYIYYTDGCVDITEPDCLGGIYCICNVRFCGIIDVEIKWIGHVNVEYILLEKFMDVYEWYLEKIKTGKEID